MSINLRRGRSLAAYAAGSGYLSWLQAAKEHAGRCASPRRWPVQDYGTAKGYRVFMKHTTCALEKRNNE